MEEAIKRIEALLKHPSDLSTKLKTSIAETQGKLKEIEEEYDENINEILKNLNMNSEIVQDIKTTSEDYRDNNFIEYKNLLDNFGHFVKDYDKIESIVIAHRNLQKICEMSQRLENFDEEVVNLQKDINGFKNSSTFNENFMILHERLYDIEEFKCFLVFYSTGADRMTVLNAQRKINGIERVKIEFLVCFAQIGNSFLDSEDIDGNLFKLVQKVIYIEEVRDKISKDVIDAKESSNMVLNEICKNNYHYEFREPYELKLKFESAMINCIRARFDKLKSPDLRIQEIEVVFDDIDKFKIIMTALRVLNNSEENDSDVQRTEEDAENPENETDNEEEASSEQKYFSREEFNSFKESIEKESKQKNENKKFRVEKSHSQSIQSHFSNKTFNNTYNSEENVDFASDEITRHTNQTYESHENKTFSNVTNQINSNEKFFTKKFNEDLITDEIKNTCTIDFDKILKTYNHELKLLIHQRQLEANEVLFVLGFAMKYHAMMEAKLKFGKEKLVENILGDNENSFVDLYIQSAIKSLSSWILNLTNNEVQKFVQRTHPPMLDEENNYVSESFISLLTMIKEQLVPICFNKKIFTSLTSEIIKLCKIFTKEIIKVMDKEFLDSFKQKTRAGYEEYVIMVGNSGLKLTQYVSTLPKTENNEVSILGNIFLEVTKGANHNLCLFIMHTCKEVFDQIFTAKWYDNDLTSIIIVTIEDFLLDYKRTMNDYMFNTFCYELINELTRTYLKQLMRKRAKIFEDCGYLIEQDVEKYKKMFYIYVNKDETDTLFQTLLKICPLLGRNTEELFALELRSLLLVCPDIKKEFIKNIIMKKTELNDAEKKQFMLKIKECFKEISNERKTIFSSLRWN
ncbi:hypothetical protein EDEG_03696 [Edhazardia aedis USNM 41457]|uniref:Uncharacterized protein n=1 Tax=Edhazardia aedis (strain USNM 41457) TaxID=1003232 RepID=J9D1S9_EDHAE|nr:hypothetical protein EDEG_03696 [Edhazardia aedis USNM 41457]|eukprot:EJW01806.1 hypothetical protein EDEG_03696 [Edhazardia aedis USNM 41457]